MSKQGKICLVSPVFFKEGKGGTEIQMYLIAKEFIRRGSEVHFIAENNENAGKEELFDGIRVHYLPKKPTRATWLNLYRIRKIMKTIKADVWYCRAALTYLFSVWINARKWGGQVIWTCSNDPYVSKNLGKGLKKESLQNKVAFYIDKFLFLKSLRQIDLIILLSHSQKELLKECWGLDGQVIYNGHPVPPIKDDKREPLILWIGNLKPSKSPGKFIELSKAVQDQPYKLVMVGKEMGYPELDDAVKTANKTLKNFKYLGGLTPGEIHGWMRKSRLLIHTSDYEGFPNVFIEAWMHGVPVVSLNVDPDDLIKKYGLGRVSFKMKQLVGDVEELMTNDELWKTLSENGIKIARKKFDIKKSVDLLIEHIDKSH